MEKRPLLHNPKSMKHRRKAWLWFLPTLFLASAGMRSQAKQSPSDATENLSHRCHPIQWHMAEALGHQPLFLGWALALKWFNPRKRKGKKLATSYSYVDRWNPKVGIYPQQKETATYICKHFLDLWPRFRREDWCHSLQNGKLAIVASSQLA